MEIGKAIWFSLLYSGRIQQAQKADYNSKRSSKRRYRNLVIIPIEALTTLNVKNNPTISLAAGGAFSIQNSSGNNIAVIDSTGTMNMSKIAIIHFK